MSLPRIFAAVIAASVVVTAPSVSAAELARTDTKGTLTVEYLYQSEGTTKRPDNTVTWKKHRVTNLTARLTAAAPSTMPTLHATTPGASGTGDGGPEAMAKAIERCGQDQQCMMQVMMNHGALQNPRDSKSGGTRYQHWYATAQQGTYEFKGTEHHDFVDMECPASRCKTDHVVTGKGSVPPPSAPGMPAAGIAAVEVDLGGSSLVISLPVPLEDLPIIRTVTANVPAGRRGSPAGTFKETSPFAEGYKGVELRFTVPLKGNWRSQSGEKVVKVKGGLPGETGTLTMRWRFVAG